MRLRKRKSFETLCTFGQRNVKPCLDFGCDPICAEPQLPENLTKGAKENISRNTVVYRIHNTISRINDLGEKDDLRKWSPKARRDLRLAGNISLVVNSSDANGQDVEIFKAPKLALLVASPTLRGLILSEPEVKEIELSHLGFEPTAVGVLCYWLTSICDWNAQAVPYLPCPDDLFQALGLRHAAQLLSMDKYVRSFEIRYFLNVHCRIPSLEEAECISHYILDNDDPLLGAWASRVGHLRRIAFLSLEDLARLADMVSMKRHKRLRDALDAAEAGFHASKQSTSLRK